MAHKTSPRQWDGHSQSCWQTAHGYRDHSNDGRRQADRLISTINDDLQKAQTNVRRSLEKRVHDIQDMEKDLEGNRDQVNTEMGRILASIEELEAHLDHVRTGPLPTATENLRMREKRIGVDLVADAVEAELNREVSVIQDVQAQLNASLQQSKQQFRELKACEVQLDDDLSCKAAAEAVDISTTSMNTSSEALGLFRDTVNRSPPQTLSPELWSGASKDNIVYARNTVGSAGRVGKSVHETLDRTTRALATQCAAVDRAFARRIQEVLVAKQNDELQIARTRDEITAQRANIAKLEHAIRAKEPPLELATTRLSTRTTRPGQELTADLAHHNLVSEAETLDSAVSRLNDQLRAAEADLAQLEDALAILSRDLEIKENSLRIDEACVALRKLHSDRRPRATEYHTSRTPAEWKNFGRTRAINM